MAGSSDIESDISVSSWGWADEDGASPTSEEKVVFRVWSVTRKQKRVGMLLLPVEVGAMDALVVAADGFIGGEAVLPA